MTDYAYAICNTDNKARQPEVLAEIARLGIPHAHAIWDFPTPYKQFLLSRIPHIEELNRPGAWGKTLAHYRAVKTAYELGQDRVLFMEDGCKFPEDEALVKNAVVSAPADWDVLMLNHGDCLAVGHENPGGWTRVDCAQGSTCYMLTRKAMAKLIDMYESPVSGKYRKPIMRKADHWMSRMYLGAGVAMYCATPNLAFWSATQP